MTSRHRKPRPPRATPQPLTPLEAYELAPALIVNLAQQAGDARAVHAQLRAWLGRYGGRDATLIATAALAMVFSECLREVPSDQLPPGELAMPAPSRTEDRRTA